MDHPHILVQLMSQLTHLSDAEIADIEASFPIRTFPKDSLLLKEGQVAQDAYYVVKGCIREYALVEGEEKTTAFFTEGQPAADFHSLSSGIPSSKYFICVEDSTVAVLGVEKEQVLYRKHPRFESFCRTGMEQMMGDQQEALSKFILMSPEQRYRRLVEERPGLLNRVPQYQLASYLGVKPETLSRIRKRISVREQPKN